MVIRTISLKLQTTPEQSATLGLLAEQFSQACNAIVPFVVEYRCWNQVKLHHLSYYTLREKMPELGSQMVCQAIQRVVDAYKALKANRGIASDKPVPVISFIPKSVIFDKKTYTLLKEDRLSLFTQTGRTRIPFVCGKHQCRLLALGTPKEATLILKKGVWYFQLALDLPNAPHMVTSKVLGVDVGENTLAATSSGKVLSGEKLRDERDRYLARRRRLQANGSKASKRKLRALSGRENRHVKHINHIVSKAIVAEAKRQGADTIKMEDLTHIRANIKAGKRVRTRLHRWAFRQLQDFIAYKAEGAGLKIQYMDPAYTSQTCSVCGKPGKRVKHRFTCVCGTQGHADVNAAVNIGLVGSIDATRGAVIRPVFSLLAK